MSLRSDTRAIQKIVGAKADGVYGPRTAGLILAHLKQADDVVELPRVTVPDSKTIDARTLKNLATLEPKAQVKFKKFILRAQAIAAALGCDYKAISGTRGKAEQNKLYAKGRTAPGRKVTNARYGYSNHNFAIALDFGVFAGNKYIDNTDPSRASAVHRAVAAVAEEYGIDWGGNWKSFKDVPHFEVKSNLTTTQKRARLFSGKPIL